MKKALAILVALIFVLTMASCGLLKKGEITEAQIGDFYLEYSGCKIVEDSYGDDAVAIYFNFTNGSEEACSFAWTLFYTLTQGNTELEYTTVFVDEDSYDCLDDNNYVDVNPNQSIEVCLTYKLVDTTTDVEVEISELIGDEETFVIKLSDAGDINIPENKNEKESSSSEYINAWQGDWYGWWTIFDGDGYYADYINEAWDCCAYVEAMNEGHLLTIWDEDYNDYYDDCLAEIMLDINPDTGVATSTGEGYFWYGSVEEGDLVIDPSDAGYDNMIVIEGSFIDNEGEYCEYGVVLTKMGYEWNDDSTYRPDYYDYFLDLMEQGLDLPTVFDPE